MPKLSIIIVNYNVKYFLEECLQSVRRAIKNVDAEIFVVDNHSVDGSVEWIREKFADVKLIANEENIGFAKANNQAIRQATGEYILLLNPDTVVQEDTVEKCIEFMNATANAGGLGIKMVDGKGNFLPESKRGFPSPWAAFCKMTGLYKLFSHSATFNHYYLGHLKNTETNEVQVLAGAFMLLRKTVLDKIGLLDEAFFMYGEDIDLSWRIVEGGYKNYYLPTTQIIHYKGESTKKATFNYVKMFYLAMIIFAKKHFQKADARWFIGGLQLAIYLKAFASFFINSFKRIAPFFVDAVLIYSGLFFLKSFWEHNIKTAAGFHYPPEFHLYVMPVYVVVWLTASYFAGGYDNPFRWLRLIRGILIGSVAIAAVYAFLPENVRFSRAIILLGTAWSLAVMLGWRLLARMIDKKSFAILGENRKILIVGEWQEAKRVQGLVNQLQIAHELIGVIKPITSNEKENYLGEIKNLTAIVDVFKVNEIIFCAKNISVAEIISWMTQINNKTDFKIVGEEGMSIVGSNSRNTAGDLYAMDFSFSIASDFGKRNKRLFDLMICMATIIFSPIIFLFSKKRSPIYQNWLAVLVARKTWIGYPSAIKNNSVTALPPLPTAVFTPAAGYQNEMDAATLEKLFFLYAKNYTVLQDLGLFWKIVWL